MLRRFRSAEDVIAEMQTLHAERGVRLFVLHDDDFAAKTGQQRRCIDRFLDLLDETGLGYDIGFMPLAGTAIEDRLKAAGRLTGSVTRPDYDLLDPRADQLAVFLTLYFSFRNSSPRGLVERLRAAAFDHVLARRFESGDWIADYGEALAGLIDRANAAALDGLDALVARVAPLPSTPESVAGIWFELMAMMGPEHQAEAAINADLKRVLARYSPALAEAFADEDREEPEDVYVYT
jgi:hypothetical protein